MIEITIKARAENLANGLNAIQEIILPTVSIMEGTRKTPDSLTYCVVSGTELTLDDEIRPVME